MIDYETKCTKHKKPCNGCYNRAYYEGTLNGYDLHKSRMKSVIMKVVEELKELLE